MEWFVPTPDGRTLAVEDAGDPGGRPVMVHVGTPNPRHLYGRTVADATARGLRLISYDRPGYGDSTPQPGRTMADCAADTRVICEALGLDRLAMWGLSFGGPHVLACAALLSDLVTAAASLCSPAPYDAEGLDWFGEFSQGDIDEVRLMFADLARRPALSKLRARGITGRRAATCQDEVMDQRISLVTLGVNNLASARAFYEALGWGGAQQPDDEVCFFQAGGMVFGLWAALGGHGAPGIELAYNVRSPEEVSEVLTEAQQAGGTIIRPAALAEWGGTSGAFADPEGYVWEVAHNPGWNLSEDGTVHI